MSGGLIIRLIDVVLIILFGFIAISDIQMKRQIHLPGKAKELRQEQNEEQVYVIVRIESDGTYKIIVDEATLQVTRDLDTVAKVLSTQINNYRVEQKRAVVIIDPHPKATMQKTIDIFDICERQGLPKSINMQLTDR